MASLVLKMSVARRLRRTSDGSTDWVAAGRSDHGASWTSRPDNAGAHLIVPPPMRWPLCPAPRAFAKAMNEIPKVVFSDSLASADWGETTIAAGDLAEAITRLKQSARTDTCSPTAGSGSPDRWSRPDDRRVPPVIHPVVLGAGERLFTAPLTIESMSTIAFSGGAVAHVFAAHPERSPSMGAAGFEPATSRV